MSPLNVRDLALKATGALPNGAATTYSGGIDLGAGEHHAKSELLISAPALTTTQQPDAKTLKYSVQHGDDVAFGDAADIAKEVIVQTGAGGAGAAAATFRWKPPSNCKRYVRIKMVGSATGDSSASSVTAELLH